ncbi:DUF202 domain-containing protein [Crateriforma spongiae]|uniref:DUF202 domain-containing protein n=1 Tax=Crateriforma spongiae TaxID=2724528 RepID=UPI0039AF83FC
MVAPEPEKDSTDRRNDLALIRTDLANERTLLAYVRTSLMFAGSGITLIKFFADLPWTRSVAWVLITAGALMLLIGIVRFIRLGRRML